MLAFFAAMAMGHISWALGGRRVRPRRQIDETALELMKTYIMNVHRPAAAPDIQKWCRAVNVGDGGGAVGVLRVVCKLHIEAWQLCMGHFT